MTEQDALQAALEELRGAWGIHYPALTPALCALAGGRPLPLDQLVLRSGLSRRSVSDVLQRLEPWLETTAAGSRLSPGSAEVVAAAAECGRRETGDQDLPAAIERIVRDVPARRRELDHVAATPETVLRRARLLARTYDLAGARVLFLGDHDLTSLALALLVPEARIDVVDVDDGLLEHVERAAGELGRTVTCRFADLRLGLPPSLRETADLAFTDPPYTPAGLRLFAVRACEAARRDERFRLLLCHGHGERQPMLGYQAQSALHDLRLLFEEVRPRFNRYTGAQAIGSASALYTLRPVSTTWRAVERTAAATPARIYTHGDMAVEARAAAVPEALLPAVRERLSASGNRPLLAGEGWPATDAADPVSLVDLWQRCGQHALLPPGRRPHLAGTVAVNLLDAPWLAFRFLLANRSPRLLLVVPARTAKTLLDAGRPEVAMLASAYRLTEAARAAGAALVEAEPRLDDVDAAGVAARYLAQHPATAIGSALREAIIQADHTAGRTTTKNEARARLDARPAVAANRDARTTELPVHVLRAIAQTLPSLTR
jgi:hypothetical protein